jgi:hypothetical protein
MKRAGIILPVFLMFRLLVNAQTGSSCATAIPLTLDAVYRNYTTSASTGSSLVCSYASSTPITYFSFTTNSLGERVILDINAPGGQPCEVVLYDGTSCNGGTLNTVSSMCFDDGTGLWSFSETFTPSPNTTYKLRIKTAIAGTLTIKGYNYTPPNDDCAGAFSISPVLITDNNANDLPGPGVVPGQLCASTLENTAFYTFTVESRGVTTFSIENISCDNGPATNSNGFQVGFFTGTCPSLVNFKCYMGMGPNIGIQTDTLEAGTKIYVAVDGLQGSNCVFGVRAINSIPLAASLKYFTAWKEPAGNILKWVSLQESDNRGFELERSADGVHFITIGYIPGQLNSTTEKIYQFNDPTPLVHSFYRLKIVSTAGKFNFSNVVLVERGNLPAIDIKVNNPVSQMMNMTLISTSAEDMLITVVNINGQVVFRDKINCTKGINAYSRNVSFLPVGRYTIIANTQNGNHITRPFIKLGIN